jgi:penicillin amidase
MWRKIVIIALALVAILLLVAPAFGLFYLHGSLPQTQGTVHIQGIDGPVEIVRDAEGVPHIFAGSDHDAHFALGYVHAQDRMWQMEMNRRIGNGRLSELLGESTLAIDKFQRTMGYRRAAEAALPALSEQTKMALEAYADGVNAWIGEGHTLPIEFLILGAQPEPWSVYDSLIWAKMMAWDLGGDYDMELLRMQLTAALGAERAAQILPAYPENAVNILEHAQIAPATAAGLLRLDSQLQSVLGLGGVNQGSNNWVIAGSRSETGMPLLADDPHLSSSIPSIWYLVELQGDRLHVVGATLPGIPGVAIGHNERIAWGVTNVGPDVQDLYVERVNPENPNQVEVNGQWQEMTVREEIIAVKGQSDPLRWAARSTRHGPLISDVQTTAMPLALRWTALDGGDTTVDAFLSVNYAANWDEFTDALSLYIAPSQNFVYADVEGNIGYYAPGRIPIRQGPDHKGMLPVPGWNDDYAWGDWIPFAELPNAFNPPSGYVATANNRVVDESYPYLLGNDWASPYRAQRIVELIEEMSSNGETISVQEMIAIQGDQASAQVRELLPFFLSIEPANERQRLALTYLAEWNGRSSMDSVAASIYEAWKIAFERALIEDDLRGDLYEEMANRAHAVFANNILNDATLQRVWCDNVLTAITETCADTGLVALDRALDDLAARLGDDLATWQWGKVHVTQYPHRPFSEVASLKGIFHRSIANGGNSYTVNVAPVRLSDLYNQYHVPSYRHIVDLANLPDSLFMTTTGQSGNVLGRHYDDFITRHRDVAYLPMTFGRENVMGDVLILQP